MTCETPQPIPVGCETPGDRHSRFARRLLSMVVLLVGTWFPAPCHLAAQTLDPASGLPEDARVDGLQKPSEFFGFQIGSRHLRHDQVVDYMRYLADSSDRVQWIPYATSHGTRPLFVLAITSPENLTQLDRVRKTHRELASGKIEAPREDDLLVMYLGYSIHGDEASGMNAAPLVAYHLASSKSAEVTERLRRSVYLLDPSLNPDGGARFAHWANENRGRLASKDPSDREHQQNWPGGRTNYYWFDLNRDWLPLTHPESQGRLRLFHDWKPNVVLDFHEMGSSSSYFFQPGVRARTNPLTPGKNVSLTKRFAIEHAKRLDAAGELFFTEERFDDFYIGKGSTYPDLQGAIGILFEQGSSRGLEIETTRTDRTFADSVANQIRTSLSSLDAAAELADQLLQYQCDFFVEAIREAETLDSYLLFGEASRITQAKTLLQLHDVRCITPNRSIMLADRLRRTDEVLLIPIAQPQSTLVRSLMSTEQSFQENIFYDVSTWHLPSAFDLSVQTIPAADWKELVAATSDPAKQRSTTRPKFDKSQLGYAVLPDSLRLPELIAWLHRDEAKLRVTTRAVEIAGPAGETIECHPGTLLILKQPNLASWPKLIGRLQSFSFDDSLHVIPLTTSVTPRGPDLGSDLMLDMEICKPALIVGDGTDAYTAGSLWHHLDVRIGQPTTLIDSVDFRGVDLDEYTVLVMPKGSYGLWGKDHAEQIKDYLERGGVVVAVCDSVRWLEKQKVLELEDATKPDADAEKGSTASPSSKAPGAESPAERKRFGDARDDAALESIAGAFFQVEIDSTHPLAYGFPDGRVPTFRQGTYHFEVPENPYQTAAIYDDVIAGYVSEKNREQLAGTAAVFTVPLGKGRVIVLADNPVFRGYVRSTEPFLTNALYLGPSFKLPKPSGDEHEH